MERSASLPFGRTRRLWHLGQLAGGIATGALGLGVRELAGGRRPHLGELLLTPANARRLADKLSEMRGAALKVGQLLSMEAGQVLPRELTDVMAGLRERAHTMPLGEVAAVLTTAWGEGWERRFRRFSFTPLAAASIGQVHEATTSEGGHLAIKVQYPGARESIDSDIDNVGALLRLFRLLPRGTELDALLQEAKEQLHAEADYRQEAHLLERYGGLLDATPGFTLPEVDPGLSTDRVLAMSFVRGRPLEVLAEEPREVRDDVATRLLALSLKEVFDWGLVQTDSNLGNYRYDADSDRIGLLDFGATRAYPRPRVEALRRLFAASVRGDHPASEEAARDAGYLGDGDPEPYRRSILRLISLAVEPARTTGAFDFGRSDLAYRMAEEVRRLRLAENVWRVPPPDILFLHRKLGGMYLACARLEARVDTERLAAGYLGSA
jgi:predicted unusual protein kinase regulating ubiquinone biosynthesis (AarF/ABC1/UbiB family)